MCTDTVHAPGRRGRGPGREKEPHTAPKGNRGKAHQPQHHSKARITHLGDEGERLGVVGLCLAELLRLDRLVPYYKQEEEDRYRSSGWLVDLSVGWLSDWLSPCGTPWPGSPCSLRSRARWWVVIERLIYRLVGSMIDRLIGGSINWMIGGLVYMVALFPEERDGGDDRLVGRLMALFPEQGGDGTMNRGLNWLISWLVIWSPCYKTRQ